MDEKIARAAFEAALGSYSEAFETFFLSRFLDLGFSYEEGRCIVDMNVQGFMFNPQGSLHGGIIGTVMDISMGHLINNEIGAGATLEMKTQFLKPIGVGRITAVGSFLQRGRSIQFLQSELRRDDGELAAFATSSWKVSSRRAARPQGQETP